MRVYGYRIHTLQPQFQRRTTKRLPLDDVSDAGGNSDSFEAFCMQVKSIEGKLQVGTPTFIQDAVTETERNKRLAESQEAPHFLLLSVSVFARKLICRVRIGRESDHDAVSSRDGVQEPMTQKAAVREYEVGFVFPEKGTHAFMISEVIGGGYAGLRLMEWVTRTAQREASILDSNGQRSESEWLNWHIEPRVDGGRIDNIMDGTTNHRIELTREGINGIGTPHGEKITLTRWGLGTTSREDISNAIHKIARRKNSGTKKDRKKQAANDLVSLVDENLKKLEFTSGELVFLENGKTQRIHSEVVEELFVYPIGNEQQDMRDLLEEAKPATLNIAAAIKQELLDY